MVKELRFLSLTVLVLMSGCFKKKAKPDTADAGPVATSVAPGDSVAEDPDDPPPTHGHSPKDIPGHQEADKKAEVEITKSNYKSVLEGMEKKAK